MSNEIQIDKAGISVSGIVKHRVLEDGLKLSIQISWSDILRGLKEIFLLVQNHACKCS